MFRRLEADKIVATLDRLERRVAERFPSSGLSQVAREVAGVARATDAAARRLRRPFVWLRLGAGLAILLGLAAQAMTARFMSFEINGADAFGVFQGLDALVNLVLLSGGAVWFLLTLEERVKRGRILARLHELRSLAHIIDMHQLTKDPTLMLAPGASTTASSPERHMTEFQLTRYLEYCSEMLSLVGKLAALYAEASRDALVVDAVNDIETLTTNLGRKIWQKITIIKQLDERPTGV